MLFSKSFGYAIRAILHMAEKKESGRYIKADEIAGSLDIPRHFLSKVMKSMAKKKILHSSKGPTGGFSVSEETWQMPLYQIALITKDVPEMNRCMLTFQTCDLQKPCPLHANLEKINLEILHFLNHTTIADLINKENTAVGPFLSALGQKNLPETTAA